MKHAIIFLMLLCCSTLCRAQATSMTVNNQTPGWLSSKINYGDQKTIENLTITGYINSTDLSFIGQLMQKQNLHKTVDLSDTFIVGDTEEDNNICFNNIFGLDSSVNLEKLALPKSITSPIPDPRIRPLGYVSVDTLIYGSEHCQVYNNALWSYVYSGGSGAVSAPRYLILRDGVTSIADYACNSSKRIETVECPPTIRFIGKGAFLDCEQLHSINLPNTIETIDFEAFRGTSLLSDTINLPKSLTQYYTTAFPIKDGQVVIIPETVTKIDNTYRTYNNTMNTWTTWDYIESSNKYTWVMKSVTPPSVTYRYEGFLKGTTIYIPHNSYASYSTKKPFSYAQLIEENIVITQIQISPSSANLAVGNSLKLNTIITPSDASTKNVLWSSTNANVATVSQDGEVKALSEGEAIIIASTQDGSNLSATCYVSIYNDIVPVSSIILEPVSIEGAENESVIINATVLPENATNKQLKWYSSDTDVATVNDGIVKLLKRGTAIITAESSDGSNIKSDCTIVVSDGAGIESIIEDKKTFVRIFNLKGHIIYEGIYADAQIDTGFYIVVRNGKSHKVKID